MKNKINIFYKIIKADPKTRDFYISNYYGHPFLSFPIGFETASSFQEQKEIIAFNLGLYIEHINFKKRGKNE